MSTDVTPEISADESRLAKKTIRNLTWRGLLLQGGFNYERFQNMGFWWVMRPTLDRLYPDPEDRAAAYKRHLVYFNTNPWVIGPIAGVVASMEERRARGAESITDETISSVKVGLMAPLAGIGDSLVFGTVRPILAAVSAGLAINGNVLGPLLFFFGLFATQWAMRIWGTSTGYRSGSKFFQQLSTVQLDRLKQGATIVGLAVTGALVATLLNVTTPLSYENGESTISVQDQLDTVLPAALPLIATLIVFALIRRRVSPIWVLIGALVVGLVAGYFGILG
ncbi:MAG: PTS system mannose/fructose/sorbose family transporter subunit IID [Microbacteriaceae bacterium]